MEKPITSANLREFIKNFMDDSLTRSRKSSVSVSTKSNALYKFKWNQFNNSALVYVEELTSKNFLETLLQSNQVSCLFVTSGKHKNSLKMSVLSQRTFIFPVLLTITKVACFRQC